MKSIFIENNIVAVILTDPVLIKSQVACLYVIE